MKPFFFLLFLFGSLFPGRGLAQVSSPPPEDTSSLDKGKLLPIVAAEAVFFVGGLSYLQYVWYKDTPRVPFHFYNDNAGYNQIDKFGHAYGAYVESLIGYHGLRKAGVSKKNALLFGGTLGFILQAPIEVFDGLYEGWGFSTGDMVANAAGSTLMVGQEILFDEQVVQFKFGYSRSVYAEQAHGYLGKNYLQSLFYDYNGHTYWFSSNANRYFLKQTLPPWLNVAVGYSAGGMFGEFQNRRYYRGQELPQTQRYRQFLLSLDLDPSKIKTNSKLLKLLFNGMVIIKIPAPALEYNTLGQLKAHWLYF